MFLMRREQFYRGTSALCIAVGVSVSSLIPTYGFAEGEADKKTEQTETTKAATPSVPVTVAPVKKQNIAAILTYSGRVEAIQTVHIHARVQGYLKQRLFEEGQMVKAGDLLFELDDALYANAVQQAEAALQAAKSKELLAQQTYSRQEKLTARDVQSQARLDDATAALDGATAGVAAAEAQLAAAKINLGYTSIYSSIDGLAGRAQVSKGDLISPASGELVSVVSQDPIYVNFPVPQDRIVDIKRRNASDNSYIFNVVFEDGTKYEHEGTFAFADNQTTTSTNSLNVRISVPNPDHILMDKSLVDVELTSRNPKMDLTIPQAALLLDQQGSYVFVVGKDKTAERRNIETGVQRQDFIVVKSGLKEGDQVITDGLQKVRPGAPLDPHSADSKS